MIQRGKCLTISGIRLNTFIILAGSLLLSPMLLAQRRPPAASDLDSILLSAPETQAQNSATPSPSVHSVVLAGSKASASPGGSNAEPAGVRPGVRRITLEQVQQASAAGNPMAHLAELQVEAARQHRLGVESDYFPKISSTLTNFHFNKFMGAVLTINRPIAGGTVTAGLPLAGENQTLVAVTAAQPLTPIFKLRQVVNLARADEVVARAKAGMPVESAANVEENYYNLLVAQRQLAVAKAGAEKLQNLRLVAANAAPPIASTPREEELTEAGDALATASTKVKELTASLDELLGLPLDTELELVPPTTEFTDISLKEATDAALANNVEVVEAEQNVVRARAASTLSKLDYVPDIAVLGGYAYQDNAVPLLPRDFSFIGLMGSYTVFDFGKRQHTVKERDAQLAMAGTAVQLTRAKVAASVKNSYFALQRYREVSELRHQLTATNQLRIVSFNQDDRDLQALWAKTEAEVFQSDLDYRQALSSLKLLMGVK